MQSGAGDGFEVGQGERERVLVENAGSLNPLHCADLLEGGRKCSHLTTRIGTHQLDVAGLGVSWNVQLL